jgi:hypothetical protein
MITSLLAVGALLCLVFRVNSVEVEVCFFGETRLSLSIILSGLELHGCVIDAQRRFSRCPQAQDDENTDTLTTRDGWINNNTANWLI